MDALSVTDGLLSRLSVVPTWLQEVDYGDLPTWLASLATIFALAFAAIAARRAKKLYGIESARDERANEERRARDQERRRSQAVLVSAWFDRKEPLETEGMGTYGAFLLNRSDALIYDVLVDFSRRGAETRASSMLRQVAPTDEGPHFIPPPTELRISTTEPLDGFEVTLTFTDSAGVRWYRDRRGVLSERT